MQKQQLLSLDQVNAMLQLFADSDVAPSAGTDGRTIGALIRRGLVAREGDTQLRITAQGREICKRNHPAKMKIRLVRFRGLDQIGQHLNNLPICENGGGRTAILVVCHSLFDMQKVQKKVDTFNAILDHAGKSYEFISHMSEQNVLVYKEVKAARVSAAS